MFENLIFLSYRRADSAPLALALKLELEVRLRAGHVFVDTHQIQGGDRWENEIETALRSAKVVLAVIGPDWAGPTEDGRRRIDDPQDWVRKELQIALDDKPEAVLPLLINKALAPRASALPAEIQGLASIQPIRLDLDLWDQSVNALVDALTHRFTFARKETRYRFPRPDPLVARTNPIVWEELDSLVKNYLPAWSIEFSDDPERQDHKRVELTKTFEFQSFREAIKFVNTVADHASRVQHHPRVMNLWRSVTIWLSTWDAGHRITPLDIEFARYLDRTFSEHRVRRKSNR